MEDTVESESIFEKYPWIAAEDGSPKGSGQASVEEVLAMQAKYGEGNIIPIRVNVDKKGSYAYGYFHAPSKHGNARMLFDKAIQNYNEKKTLENGRLIIGNCWISGDERIKTNDMVNVTAALALANCFDFLEVDSVVI